ncbi:hypothetical protein COU74_01905 [Candidatus Peregrinibacteria bacterium CG10_big_fil_rev_8_21_14_0_10_36_19]|nr:MAG: hypothetical protein COU74_01905 [Candidatus Peregrinibacteria bacterium CG10_big_fil_rev_8_21_14_0_10_36_19]
MEVNYSLVAAAVVAQFVLGAFWYSPLMFGKWWMEIMECTDCSPEKMKKMQKEMTPFYFVQLLLTLLLTVSLANLAPYMGGFSIYHVAFWVWIGFIVPTQVACVIWANTKRKYWLKQIFVMVGNQLASLMLASWILSL